MEVCERVHLEKTFKLFHVFIKREEGETLMSAVLVCASELHNDQNKQQHSFTSYLKSVRGISHELCVKEALKTTMSAHA